MPDYRPTEHQRLPELQLPDPGQGRYWVVEKELDRNGSVDFQLVLRSRGNDKLDVELLMQPTASHFIDAARSILARMRVIDSGWVGEHRFNKEN